MFAQTSPNPLSGKAGALLHWKYIAWMLFGVTIFLVGAYLGEPHTKQQSAQAHHPAVDELYLVDFSELFDDADPVYRYGVMKVASVDAEEVELLVGKLAYNQIAGPRSDIEYNETSLRSYYESESIRVKRSELKQLWEAGAARPVVSI